MIGAKEVGWEMMERCKMLRRLKFRVEIGELILIPFNHWFDECEMEGVPKVEGKWTEIRRRFEVDQEEEIEEEELLDRLVEKDRQLYEEGRKEYRDDLWRIYLMLIEHGMSFSPQNRSCLIASR
jgi:hypothetical protein